MKVIYLLGHSRSGSTVLCMHLDRLKAVHYIGEIKMFDRSVLQRNCTCGRSAKVCPFWGPVISEHTSFFDRPVRSDSGWSVSLRLCKALLFGFTKMTIQKEKDFLAHLDQKIREENEQYQYFLDSSKSISRLHLYQKMKPDQLEIIYLTRDLRANIASFVKRGKGVISSFLRIKVNDLLIRMYLKMHGLDATKMGYEEFVENPEASIEAIRKLIKIPNEEENDKIETNNLHLISGNNKTRKITVERNYEIVKDMNLQDPFSPFQKVLLRFLGV